MNFLCIVNHSWDDSQSLRLQLDPRTDARILYTTKLGFVKDDAAGFQTERAEANPDISLALNAELVPGGIIILYWGNDIDLPVS